MPVYHRYHQVLHIALILVLCMLALSACRQEVAEPTVEPPIAAPEEAAAPAQEPAPTEPAPEATPLPTPTTIPEPIEIQEPSELDEPSEPQMGDDIEDDDVGVDDMDLDEEEIDEATAAAIAEALAGIAVPEVASTPAPAPQLQVSGAVATRVPSQVIATSALTIRPDETVAPPLSIEVSANRQLTGNRFQISGLLQNDDAVPYSSLGVIATFFRTDGSRYGPVHARIQCPILAPQEVCPFIVEARDKDLVAVMLHPEGGPTDRRQPLTMELRTTRRYVDNIGYVRILGTVSNPNPVTAQDITINGVLLDEGEIVAIGAALILGPIAPGESAPFDVMIRYAPYSQTQLYVQALAPQ
jgi:hypothetical protein